MKEVADRHPRYGPEPKYPTEQWLDGQQWRLKHGEDFTCLAHAFVNYLRRIAKRQGKRVEVRYESPNVVLVQSHHVNGE